MVALSIPKKLLPIIFFIFPQAVVADYHLKQLTYLPTVFRAEAISPCSASARGLEIEKFLLRWAKCSHGHAARFFCYLNDYPTPSLLLPMVTWHDCRVTSSRTMLSAWEHHCARSLAGRIFSLFGTNHDSLSSCIEIWGGLCPPSFFTREAPGIGLRINQPAVHYLTEECVSRQGSSGQHCAWYSMHLFSSDFETVGASNYPPPPSSNYFSNYQRSDLGGGKTEGNRWRFMVCAIFSYGSDVPHQLPTEGLLGINGRRPTPVGRPFIQFSPFTEIESSKVSHCLNVLFFLPDCGTMDILTDNVTPSQNVRIYAPCATKRRLFHLPTLQCLGEDAYPNGATPHGWIHIHASAIFSGTPTNRVGEFSSQPTLLSLSIIEDSYHTFYRHHTLKSRSFIGKPYPGFAVGAFALAVTFQPARPRSELALFLS